MSSINDLPEGIIPTIFTCDTLADYVNSQLTDHVLAEELALDADERTRFRNHLQALKKCTTTAQLNELTHSKPVEGGHGARTLTFSPDTFKVWGNNLRLDSERRHACYALYASHRNMGYTSVHARAPDRCDDSLKEWCVFSEGHPLGIHKAYDMREMTETHAMESRILAHRLRPGCQNAESGFTEGTRVFDADARTLSGVSMV